MNLKARRPFMIRETNETLHKIERQGLSSYRDSLRERGWFAKVKKPRRKKVCS